MQQKREFSGGDLGQSVMPVLRTDIEKGLDEIIAHEEGKRFQALAVVLAKQKYPDLIASEYHKDLGLDAYAAPSDASDRVGRGVASSITATLAKITADARRAKENFPELKTLIFFTPRSVTNQTKAEWAEEVGKEFGYELLAISREDVITSLMLPENISLCRSSLRIAIAIESGDQVALEQVREAVAEEAANWRASTRIGGRPVIGLHAVILDAQGQETADTLDVAGLQTALHEGRRVALEAPGGGGKTTTLIQLGSQQGQNGGLAFLIDLPAWIRSGADLLDFIASLPAFRSRSIAASDLARLSKIEQVRFLLNGWNEITAFRSQDAVTALRQLERSFPAAGIIVATRTHYVSPPLPGAIRARLRPLTRRQRADYLRETLGERADELRLHIENNRALDALTRTPLILSEVATLFQSGRPVPTTRIGVLGAVMKLVEESEDHQSHLQGPPLDGNAPGYLTHLAAEMTKRAETASDEETARGIVRAVVEALQRAGQLTTPPQPAAVLNALCAHHVLERLEQPTTAFRFQHQQFQEFYAARFLAGVLLDLGRSADAARDRAFAEAYLNNPMWEESLLMVAEDIATRCTNERDRSDAIAAGHRLVTLALVVDPVLAAELSQLSGTLVWEAVRPRVGECLRSWYAANDAHHKQCAIAAILATGSPDFADILVPLLSNDDQQIRLSTYRAGGTFYPSSLGPDWRRIVVGWTDASRSDFVHEAAQRFGGTDIGASFARTDPSHDVRIQAIQALSWIGATDALTRALNSYADESFDAVLPGLIPEMTPPALRERAIAAHRRLLQAEAEPLPRLRRLLILVEFDDVKAPPDIKTELSRLPTGRFDQYAEHAIGTALGIVKKTDPQWVSDWVAGRLLDGSLWSDQWSRFLSQIPETQADALFNRIAREELQPRELSAIQVILRVAAEPRLAQSIFSRLCDYRKTIAAAGPAKTAAWGLYDRLRNLFRALPVEVAVAGLLQAASDTFDPGQFMTAVDLFGRIGANAPQLRAALPAPLRQSFRQFLKDGIANVLRSGTFSDETRAHAALALGRIGDTDDTVELRNLIETDIQAKPRQGGAVSYANWYAEALLWLDCPGVEAVLLDLLRQPKYEEHAARSLVRLAVPPEKQPALLGAPKLDFDAIWAARQGTASGIDDVRAKRYADAIRSRIDELMAERSGAAQPDSLSRRLKTLAPFLAKLDGRDSSAMVIDGVSLPGQWDGWIRVWSIQALLSAGATLTTEQIVRTLNPVIEDLLKQGLYNDQNLFLLTNCLCLLPFTADPAKGVARINEVLSSFQHRPYQFRDLVDALGNSRADAAVELLLGFARQPNGLQNMEDEWIEALGRLGTVETQRALLSFIDPDIPWLGVSINFDHGNKGRFASQVSAWARDDATLRQRLFALCEMAVSPVARSLLAAIMDDLGTGDALFAGLGIINDRLSPTVPYDLFKGLENLFLERRPYGDTSGAFVYAPRRADEIRAKLFAMVVSDPSRRKSAFSLLGQIEVWRLEYGRPDDEPRHPSFDSGQPWPPLALIKEHAL